MNNKKNLLLLLSSLFLVTFIASCGEVATNPTLPSVENSDTTNQENSEAPDAGDDEWIWWDDVETDNDEEEEEDDSPKYNTINYLVDYMYYGTGTDYSETKTFDPANGVHKYEAELCAELTGMAIVEKDTHVGYLEDDATVTFTITSTEACNVLLAASLSTNPNTPEGIWFDSQYAVKVNNVEVDTGDVWILPTLSWYEFKSNPLAAIDLVEGENVIEFTGYSGQSNIDSITLAPKRGDLVIPEFTYTSPTKIEAEDCYLTDCEIEEVDGLSNGKNIGYTTANTALEFYLNVEEDVETKLSVNTVICANSQYSPKVNKRFGVNVNGVDIEVNNKELPITDESSVRWWLQGYSDLEIATLKLKKGKNYIAIKLTKELNLDYLIFS